MDNRVRYGREPDRVPPSVDNILITLDLHGHGVRGMAYFPALNGYLIISGTATRDTSLFQLWLWRGDTTHQPIRMVVDGLDDLEHAEGVCPALIEGLARIVIVSDDGDRKSGRYARYLILDPAYLQPAT